VYAKANKKIKPTAKSVTNFAKRRKICAPFYRRLFWRYVQQIKLGFWKEVKYGKY